MFQCLKLDDFEVCPSSDCSLKFRKRFAGISYADLEEQM